MQLDDPGQVENNPAPHRTQTELAVLAAAELNVPAAQKMHDLPPKPVWYPPELQLEQEKAPEKLE
jgi:hypothetical protein